MEAFSYFVDDSAYLQQISNASSPFTCYNSSDAPQPSSEKGYNFKQQAADHGSCFSTAHTKGGNGKRSKRQRKSITEGEHGKDMGEPPSGGYIHVRARRGQATDSHSLAERVRRERISERMKKLQGLVPGCDKVIGKALVLDEIINYIQSLQNQVEFLSMKLASANPVVYDFGTDYNDNLTNQPEEMGGMSQPMASDVIQHNPAHATSEDFGSLLMQVGLLHNMCSFH